MEFGLEKENPCIEGEVVVNAKVGEVWKAWTTEAGVKSFFSPDCKVELKVGGKYEMYFDLSQKKGNRGGEGVKIMAFHEPCMLSFSWNAPPHMPAIRKQFTHVTVRLQKSGKTKTLVQLFHDGWGSGPEWIAAFKYFQRAWLEIVLPRLKHRFSVGPIDWDNPPEISK